MFAGHDMRPIIDMQSVVESHSALATFSGFALLMENLMREKAYHGMQVLARAAAKKEDGVKTEAKKTSKSETQTYSLVYINPETKKAETISAKSTIKIDDTAKRMVEESMGMRTTAPMYKFISTPLVMKRVDPYKLKEILDQREYGTPPPFGGAAKVKLTAEKKKVESEIVAVKQDRKARSGLKLSLLRKKRMEAAITEELMVLREVMAEIEGGAELEEALARLPPLTRARFQVALKIKKLDREAVVSLLKKDVRFLKKMKDKLKKLTKKELLKLVKMFRLIGRF